MQRNDLTAYIAAHIGTKTAHHSISPADVAGSLQLLLDNAALTEEMEAAIADIEIAGSTVPEANQKEVVAVSTYADLLDIVEPSQNVVYITEDTSKLYLFNGSTFVEQTGVPTADRSMYCTVDRALAQIYAPHPLQPGLYYVYSAIPGSGTGRILYSWAMYTLVVTQNPDLSVISNHEGWADITTDQNDNHQWLWRRYAYRNRLKTINGESVVIDSDYPIMADIKTAVQDTVHTETSGSVTVIPGTVHLFAGVVDTLTLSKGTEPSDGRTILYHIIVSTASTFPSGASISFAGFGSLSNFKWVTPAPTPAASHTYEYSILKAAGKYYAIGKEVA